MMRRRTKRDYSRRAPTREARRAVLIICEGKTERQYLSEFKLTIDDKALEIKITSVDPDPKSIVRAAGRSAQSGDGYDEIWCALDLDGRVDQVQAAKRAVAKMPGKVRMALSNPCFELWLLWHFRDQDAHLDQSHALEILRKDWPEYVKGQRSIMKSIVRENLDAAIDRADAAAARIKRDDIGFPDDNPSSEVPALLRSLRGHTPPSQ